MKFFIALEDNSRATNSGSVAFGVSLIRRVHSPVRFFPQSWDCNAGSLKSPYNYQGEPRADRYKWSYIEQPL